MDKKYGTHRRVKPMKIRNGSLSDTSQMLFRWNNEQGMLSFIPKKMNLK
jgi:hypothetical protein